MSLKIEERQKIFIEKSTMIHNDKYDYSKVIYVSNKNKVIIICPIHGEFQQTPDNHSSGKCGCPLCADIVRRNKRKLDVGSFISRAKMVHGDVYDYSKVIYNRITDKVTIICKTHGEFIQSGNDHINGKYGCRKCHTDKMSKKLSKSSSKFISDCKEVHGETYSYFKTEYIKNSIKVCITCKYHGDFFQLPNNHLRGHGCPTCSQSKGERKIREYLENNSFSFIEEHMFDDCINPSTNYKLRFDFFIPDINTIIEYDGVQHSVAIEFFGGEDALNKTQINDQIKNEYAHKNEIALIRVSYTEIDSIDTILTKTLYTRG